MANRKFYVMYKNENGDRLQPVRKWAEENRKYFPGYTFTNRNSDFPITHEIARVLEFKLNYKRVEENGNVYLVKMS